MKMNSTQLLTYSILDFSKFNYFHQKVENSMKNFLRIVYIENFIKITTNAIFLTYPQTSIESTSIEIIYLRIVFKNDSYSEYEYEIRRSECKLIKISEEIFIQDEIMVFFLSHTCFSLIIKIFDRLSQNDMILTNLRKGVLSKRRVSNFCLRFMQY